jgi:hypothetical protein
MGQGIATKAKQAVIVFSLIAVARKTNVMDIIVVVVLCVRNSNPSQRLS